MAPIKSLLPESISYGEIRCVLNADGRKGQDEVSAFLARPHATREEMKAVFVNVIVRFDQEDGRVRISIQDDGRGFDPSTVTGKEGQVFGLDIMRERTKGIGGTLELDSRPGHGTRIVVRVPKSGKA